MAEQPTDFMSRFEVEVCWEERRKPCIIYLLRSEAFMCCRGCSKTVSMGYITPQLQKLDGRRGNTIKHESTSRHVHRRVMKISVRLRLYMVPEFEARTGAYRKHLVSLLNNKIFGAEAKFTLGKLIGLVNIQGRFGCICKEIP